MVWAMHNPSTSSRTIYIRNVRGRVVFDGTAVAATTSGYEFVKFTVADPSTGTTVARVKKRAAYPVSQIQDANIQQKSGALTMTGIANIDVVNVVRLPLSITGTIANFDLDFVVAGMPYEGFELAPNEGFGIRLVAAAVIGLGIGGSVEWDER